MVTPVLAAPAAAVDIAAAAIADPLPAGQASRTWSKNTYIESWERHRGRPMTPQERRNLDRGCIGVTQVNLGRFIPSNPPLDLSFDRLSKARRVQSALDRILRKNPTPAQFRAAVRQDEVLSTLKNMDKVLPNDTPSGTLNAQIYSKRFWSNGAAYAPDGNDQVDMSGYRYQARPGGYTNYDYGWWDQSIDNWWHANHAEPGMKIYQSTLAHYSRPLEDFDRQVFIVGLARKY
ncbi:hypothetical protein D5S17_22185 [Pseudonocardiaceae bacterium YIM PH 21723]|nr:hypothetical protein D5S17_22185 [Pseudonocardiaceae bacterium YIM PH 21723]